MSDAAWAAQQAARICHQARDDRLDIIDLSCLGLAEITSAIPLPRDGIKRVILRKNHLIAIPEQLRLLTSLKSLSIDSNRLTSLGIAVLPSLSGLTYVSLRGNQIVELPPTISQLAKLEVLDVSENKISALPSEICRLTALTSLFALGCPHLRWISPVLAATKARLLLDVPLLFPPEVSKMTAVEIIAYVRDMNRLKLLLDLRSHFPPVGTAVKCAVCFTAFTGSRMKVSNCSVCGHWTCAKCTCRVVIAEFQVEEPVAVCTRCIEQLQLKDVPRGERKVSRPPRPSSLAPLEPATADLELYGQLQRTKQELAALQSTERTLRGLLQFYADNTPDRVRTEEQLVGIREEVEALSRRFKSILVLITQRASKARATARLPSLTELPTPAALPPVPDRRPPGLPSVGMSGLPPPPSSPQTSPRSWVKVEPDSRPRLRAPLVADAPMSKPVLGLKGRGMRSPSPLPLAPIPASPPAHGLPPPPTEAAPLPPRATERLSLSQFDLERRSTSAQAEGRKDTVWASVLAAGSAMPVGYSDKLSALGSSCSSSSTRDSVQFLNPIFSSTDARTTIAPLSGAEQLPEPVALPDGALPLMRQARARFKFKREKLSELPFQPGDVIIVTDTSGDEWWFGFAGGESGFFPKAYVSLLDS